tara:strand:+ start:368 stop:553 length:186 start_codon:yes stop_codon:yes gene_type:complete
VCCFVVGVAQTLDKKALGAPEARKKWSQCVSEFGEMVSQEVKTNPRYNKLQIDIGKEEPPR